MWQTIIYSFARLSFNKGPYFVFVCSLLIILVVLESWCHPVYHFAFMLILYILA